MSTYTLSIEAEDEDEATAEVASLLGTEPLPWVKEEDGKTALLRGTLFWGFAFLACTAFWIRLAMWVIHR